MSISLLRELYFLPSNHLIFNMDGFINETQLLDEGLLSVLNTIERWISIALQDDQPLQHGDTIADILAAIRCYKYIYDDPTTGEVLGIDSLIGHDITDKDAVQNLRKAMHSCEPQYRMEQRQVQSIILHDLHTGYDELKQIVHKEKQWVMQHRKQLSQTQA